MSTEKDVKISNGVEQNKSYLDRDKDLIYIVDENTGEIDKNRYAAKQEIHDKGLWHVECDLFIINKKGQILTQKRSQNVRFNKGKFGIVANHPTIHQTNIDCILEKAKEELGIELNKDSIMFLMVAKRETSVFNKKIQYTYYTMFDFDEKQIKLNPFFSTEYKWWNYYDLFDKMMQNKDDREFSFNSLVPSKNQTSDVVFKCNNYNLLLFSELKKVIDKNTHTNKVVKNRELLLLETKDKTTLPCILYKPYKKVKNIVIFVHGSGGNFFKQSYLDDLIHHVLYKDCAFMTFNNRGAEQEVNLYKMVGDRYERFKGGSKFENFSESVLDIEAAINEAKNQGFENIILIGHSLGTLKVMNYALKNKDIKNIVIMSPIDAVFRFKARVGIEYDRYISLAKDKVLAGQGYDMLTNEFSALKIYSTYREGCDADTIAYEEGRCDKVLDYDGDVVIIKGTKDHVYGNYSPAYVDEAFRKQFSKANLAIFNIPNADHSYKGYSKVSAKLLADSIERLLKND